MLASGGLRLAVHLQVAPLLYGGLIAPEGQRQHLAGLAQAFKPLNGDKTIYLLQMRAQMGSSVQVGLAVLSVRQHFKNYGNHVGLLVDGWQNVPSTTSTKERSSRKMKRWLCANSKLARPSGSVRRRAR